MIHKSNINDNAEIVILDNFFDVQTVICVLLGYCHFEKLGLSFLRISLKTRFVGNDPIYVLVITDDWARNENMVSNLIETGQSTESWGEIIQDNLSCYHQSLSVLLLSFIFYVQYSFKTLTSHYLFSLSSNIQFMIDQILFFLRNLICTNSSNYISISFGYILLNKTSFMKYQKSE